jgi:uncharacterized membrane protein
MDKENRLQLSFYQCIHSLLQNPRDEIVENIRTSSSPRFDDLFLVVVSSTITPLGLNNDPPAAIIGAMLVALLMSPIFGVGLGSITVDASLTHNSVPVLIRGALLSVILSALLLLSSIYLPIVPSLLAIPNEVLSRTQPNPNDLIIALAGGLAAAYSLTEPHLSAALPCAAIATTLIPPFSSFGNGIALGRWDTAGGATLLVLTISVTFAFAVTLIFSLKGVVPKLKKLLRNDQELCWSQAYTKVCC